MNNAEKGNYSVAYWSVDDIDAALKKLIENAATIVSEITNVGDGIRVAVINDPFGNIIGLIEEKK